jgi:hypothetical protein
VNNPDAQETIRLTLMLAKEAGINIVYRKGKTADEKLRGARIALIDKVSGIVGHVIASRIPPKGWTPQELHKMTDNTRFDGTGDFADWACHMTGCVVLDYSYEAAEFIEGSSEPVFKWTKYNVQQLTGQYPKVREIRRKIDHLVQWLELDPLNNFRDLLSFLLEKGLPKRRKALPIFPDPNGYLPLDQECDDDYQSGELPDFMKEINEENESEEVNESGAVPV